MKGLKGSEHHVLPGGETPAIDNYKWKVINDRREPGARGVTNAL